MMHEMGGGPPEQRAELELSSESLANQGVTVFRELLKKYAKLDTAELATFPMEERAESDPLYTDSVAMKLYEAVLNTLELQDQVALVKEILPQGPVVVEAFLKDKIPNLPSMLQDEAARAQRDLAQVLDVGDNKGALFRSGTATV